jgi:molybdenum cofactor biosynthesis enzyme MoaA
MSRKNKNQTQDIEHQEPEVATQQPPELTERQAEPATHFWPADKPVPTAYIKPRRQPPPCPKCRRTQLANGGQAAACTSSGKDVAFFQCRGCGHRWKLAVRES